MAVFPATGPRRETEETIESFDSLMPFRVQDILLVSSLYDSFILREDGRLNELLIGESRELDHSIFRGSRMSRIARRRWSWCGREPRFNLIVTNLAVGEMNAAQLAREIRKLGIDVPVLVLAYDYREVKNFVARNRVSDARPHFPVAGQRAGADRDGEVHRGQAQRTA